MTLTRRELLKAGASASAALAAGWRPLLGRQDDLIMKPIPSTGEMIPAVGIGTRNYGIPNQEALPALQQTVQRFLELGGTVLDTAPSYGNRIDRETRSFKNSEHVLGEIMTALGARDDIFLAGKVDREGRDAGIARMEASYEALQTDTIDLMQVHNMRDTATQLATLREWKAAGRVRYIGVTTSRDSQYELVEDAIADEEMDFVQVDYSLANRSAAERILPAARDRGVAVLINLPFGRGRLFRAVGDRSLPEWAAECDCASWGQFFLKYLIAHPAVTCPIPGTRQLKHVEDNMGAVRGRLPDAALRRRMEEFIDSL